MNGNPTMTFEDAFQRLLRLTEEKFQELMEFHRDLKMVDTINEAYVTAEGDYHCLVSQLFHLKLVWKVAIEQLTKEVNLLEAIAKAEADWEAIKKTMVQS